MSLYSFFNDLYENYTANANVSTGKGLETYIEDTLESYGFEVFRNRQELEHAMEHDDILKDLYDFVYDRLTKEALKDHDTTVIGDSNFDGIVLCQIYGANNPPDFIVFDDGNVYTIETKFSKDSGTPMWNNSYPKQNDIVIFANPRDITFFKGSNVISLSHASEIKKMIEEMVELMKDKFEKTINETIEENSELSELEEELGDYGFEPYIRVNYIQTKKHNNKAIINYFNNPNRIKLEDRVLRYVE